MSRTARREIGGYAVGGGRAWDRHGPVESCCCAILRFSHQRRLRSNVLACPSTQASPTPPALQVGLDRGHAAWNCLFTVLSGCWGAAMHAAVSPASAQRSLSPCLSVDDVLSPVRQGPGARPAAQHPLEPVDGVRAGLQRRGGQCTEPFQRRRLCRRLYRAHAGQFLQPGRESAVLHLHQRRAVHVLLACLYQRHPRYSHLSLCRQL